MYYILATEESTLLCVSHINWELGYKSEFINFNSHCPTITSRISSLVSHVADFWYLRLVEFACNITCGFKDFEDLYGFKI